MDLLYERAASFAGLLHFRYRIIAARKNKEYIFEIDFRPEDFHHLIGLKKLTDLEGLKKSREKIFNDILSGIITYETVARSQHWEEIEERFLYFEYFPALFLDKNSVFKYTQDLQYSKIPADYLLVNESYADKLYLFFRKRKNEDLYSCVSFFPYKKREYEKGQTSLTILKIEQINSCDGITCEIYRNPNYIEK